MATHKGTLTENEVQANVAIHGKNPRRISQAKRDVNQEAVKFGGEIKTDSPDEIKEMPQESYEHGQPDHRTLMEFIFR